MEELNPNHPSRFFIRPTKHNNVKNQVSKYLETIFVVGYTTFSSYDYTTNKMNYHKTADVIKIKDICYN